MSIVNQMLNDLQQSKHPSPVMDELMSLPDAEPKKQRVYSLLVILILLIIAGALTRWLNQEPSIISHQSMLTEIKMKSDNIDNENGQAKLIKKEPAQQKVVIQTYNFETSFNPATETSEATQLKMLQTSFSPITKKTTREIVFQPKNVAPSRQKTSAVKKTSRISSAEKELARLIKQWQLGNSIDQHHNLLALLDNYSDLPTIWLDSLTFLKSKNRAYYEKLLDRSITTFPEKNRFVLLAAQYYFSSAQYSKALRQLDNIQEKRKDQRIYQLTGLVLQKLGDHQQAIESYKKLLVISPARGEISMAIGISYDALKQPKQAISHFVIALKDIHLNPIQKQFVRQRLIAYQG